MNKNSNTYIITYATVLVVVVAAILSIAAISLKSRQEANVLIEKQTAILASVGRADIPADVKDKDQYVQNAYAQYIKRSFFVDAQGNEKDATASEVLASLSKLPEVFAQKQAMPVFEAQGANGNMLYVIPVTGKGLWGPVWGYLALNSDCNTVEGIVLDHKSETPGLGAEIATKSFQDQFIGKKLFNENEFVSINLLKGAGSSAGNPFAVDAVSGGTLTSNGVRDMLKSCLSDYVPFFEKVRNNATKSVAADSLAQSDSTVTINNDGGVE